MAGISKVLCHVRDSDLDRRFYTSRLESFMTVRRAERTSSYAMFTMVPKQTLGYLDDP